jgi:hypothetical protein
MIKKKLPVDQWKTVPAGIVKTLMEPAEASKVGDAALAKLSLRMMIMSRYKKNCPAVIAMVFFSLTHPTS